MEDVLALEENGAICLSNADALQMCAHQSVGWGLPVISALCFWGVFSPTL